MKGLKLLVQCSAIFFLNSCTTEVNYKRTASGLEYYFYEKTDTGQPGKPGDFYLVDMIGQREDDSIFINSYNMGQKIKMVRSKPPLHSLFSDGLAMLRIGDSVIIRIRADSFFKPIAQPVPGYLRSNERIRFTLKVKDILGPQQHLLKMYEYELEKMEVYLRNKKWNYLTDSTGIKYEMVVKGNQLKANEGDEVEVSYLLTYLDGKIINRTRPGDRLKFIVGSPEFIPGLSRLAVLIPEGSKVQAIIPFSEGFGESGSAYVDPYATLIIEMELVKVNKKSF